ncbi:hypothetical protein HYU14_07010 [Candidatus Woesearchaeota archaeon]|nr:hypothetical protein [Candidatus Woesearchaeota archaeon]
MPKKNGKQTISLSVDSKTYEEFTGQCREKGLIISKQVENFMKGQVGEGMLAEAQPGEGTQAKGGKHGK